MKFLYYCFYILFMFYSLLGLHLCTLLFGIGNQVLSLEVTCNFRLNFKIGRISVKPN